MSIDRRNEVSFVSSNVLQAIERLAATAPAVALILGDFREEWAWEAEFKRTGNSLSGGSGWTILGFNQHTKVLPLAPKQAQHIPTYQAGGVA